MQYILISKTIKVLYFTLLLVYIYIKVYNYKLSIDKRVLLLVTSISLTFLYSLFAKYDNYAIIHYIIFILYGCILVKVCNVRINGFINSFLIIYVIAFAIHSISLISIAIPAYFLKIEYQSPVIALFTIPFLCILTYLIFKIKRLKNGLNFLNINSYKLNKDIIICFIITAILLSTIIFILKNKYSTDFWNNASIVVICTITFLYYATSRFITRCYKDRMKDRTIEVQKLEIENNSKKILELQEENMRMAKAVHKYNHKISAIELGLKEELAKYDTEFSSELSGVLTETDNMAKQFAKETKVVTTLPKTGILGIDNILKYEQTEAIKAGINFDLKIVNNISEIIPNILSQDKVETLFADHIKDAIIAINNSNTKVKNILVVLGKVDGVFEISFYDTGIEFTIPTLLKLGTTPITTHKDSGGSGIGFMTTFDTLNSCMASLCIEEYRPGTSNFTKSVTISLDGRGEYRIYSYRASEIKKAHNVDNVQRIRIRNI